MFKTQKDDQGYQMLRTLLQNSQISAQYALAPQTASPAASTGQPPSAA